MRTALDWPLVGRDNELAQIREAFADERIHSLLLVGEPGVGKTRLARSALATISREGHGRWLEATEAASAIRFGGVAGLISSIPAGISTDIDLIRHLRSELLAEKGDGPLLLGIDDANLLDDGSATLIHQLVSDGSCFAIATYRLGEPTTDFVTSMWKEDQGYRIDLQPLGDDAVSELSRAVLGDPLDDVSMRRVISLSGGNPLFVRELLLGGVESGDLQRMDGIWIERGSLTHADRLVEVVRARLALLEPAERNVLDVLAIAGPVEVDVLERMTNPGASRRLNDRHLVRTEVDGRRSVVSMSHPLHSEVLSDLMPGTRRAQITTSLADALEDLGRRRRSDSLRIAAWRLESGSDVTPDVLIEAATQALLSFDLTRAEQLANHAVEAGAGFEAEMLQARAMSAAGRFGEAESVLRGLHSRAEDAGELGQVVLARSSNLFSSDPAAAASVIHESGIRDGIWKDQLDATLMFVESVRGNVLEAIRIGQSLLSREAVSTAARLKAISPLVFARCMAGQLDGVEALISEGRRLASEHPGVWIESDGYLRVAHMALERFMGQLAVSEALGTEIVAEALQSRLPWFVENVAWYNLAFTLELRGQLARAISLLTRTMDNADSQIRCLSHADRARARSALGYVSAGREDVETARRLFASGAIAYGDYPYLRAEGWINAQSGDLARAAELALDAGRSARDRGYYVWAGLAFHDVVRFRRPEAVSRELGELVAQIDGRFYPTLADHCDALLEKDGDRLDVVARRLSEMGADLLSAEASAQAAVEHRRVGAVDRERKSRARAFAMAGRCGPVETPPLVAIRSPGLTRREHQIATLAAMGLTNRNISEQLMVSIRTVENHLARAYPKLGVHRRSELLDALAMDPD